MTGVTGECKYDYVVIIHEFHKLEVKCVGVV